MRQMVMIVVIAMAVMALRVDVGMASENSCQAIYADVVRKHLYRASGDCSEWDSEEENARNACREHASSPEDCIPGAMSSLGVGLAELSRCDRGEYIGIACVTKSGRPYCRVSCGQSQFEADRQARETCDGVHGTQNCKIQNIPKRR